MSTISTENYLKALYHLQSRGDGPVSSGALAKAIDVAHPSATRALKTLAAAGLVEHEPYRGARLTDAGTAAALRVIRKHRLVEVFLVEVLGYDWDEVHDEAERLEHAISDRLADRIDAFLGHPQVDPHGDPIPAADGSMPTHAWVPLDSVGDGTCVTVARVLSQDTAVLRYMDSVGIRPGRTLTVQGRAPFDGPVVVETGENEASISRSLARTVLVSGPPSTSDELGG